MIRCYNYWKKDYDFFVLIDIESTVSYARPVPRRSMTLTLLNFSLAIDLWELKEE